MLQNRGHWPPVSLKDFSWFCLSLSLIWEREWVCIIDSSVGSLSLSYFLDFDMREWLVHSFQQWVNWSDWENVTLHCWFSANGRFPKVRGGYFALLILGKWKISQEKCADHKASATFLPFLRKLTVSVNFCMGGNRLLLLYSIDSFPSSWRFLISCFSWWFLSS